MDVAKAREREEAARRKRRDACSRYTEVLHAEVSARGELRRTYAELEAAIAARRAAEERDGEGRDG